MSTDGQGDGLSAWGAATTWGLPQMAAGVARELWSCESDRYYWDGGGVALTTQDL